MKMFCSKCGKENANDAKFCAGCGAGLSMSGNKADPSANSSVEIAEGNYSMSEAFIKSAHFDTMLGVKANYYRAPFLHLNEIATQVENAKGQEEIQKLSKKLMTQGGFNWGAFFFTNGWMAYRKMNAAAIALAVVMLVIDIACELLPPFFALSVLIVYIGFGFFANYFFYLHVKKELPNCKNKEQLMSIGETNIGVGAIAFVAYWFVAVGIAAVIHR